MGGGVGLDVSPLDALIITAADGEDEAVRCTGDWRKIEGPSGYPLEVWSATFSTVTGGSLRIAVSRAFAMGTDSAAHAAAALTQHFRPRCLAMCGVCAGRPHWTKLGDVIIADRVYRYDVGELTNNIQGGVPRFRADLLTFPLRASWKQAALHWTVPTDARWLSERPLPLEIQTAWVLQELRARRDPRSAPQQVRNERCPDMADVLVALTAKELVETGTNGEIGLRVAGTVQANDLLYAHPGGIPPLPDFTVHVGPLATGSSLVRDVDIWDRLVLDQRLVRGFDMEASVIGVAAFLSEIPWIVVKGVMDFAEPDRGQRFRRFAARAAAEVLVGFLCQNLDHAPRPSAPSVSVGGAHPALTARSEAPYTVVLEGINADGAVAITAFNRSSAPAVVTKVTATTLYSCVVLAERPEFAMAGDSGRREPRVELEMELYETPAAERRLGGGELVDRTETRSLIAANEVVTLDGGSSASFLLKGTARARRKGAHETAFWIGDARCMFLDLVFTFVEPSGDIYELRLEPVIEVASIRDGKHPRDGGRAVCVEHPPEMRSVLIALASAQQMRDEGQRSFGPLEKASAPVVSTLERPRLTSTFLEHLAESRVLPPDLHALLFREIVVRDASVCDVASYWNFKRPYLLVTALDHLGTLLNSAERAGNCESSKEARTVLQAIMNDSAVTIPDIVRVRIGRLLHGLPIDRWVKDAVFFWDREDPTHSPRSSAGAWRTDAAATIVFHQYCMALLSAEPRFGRGFKEKAARYAQLEALRTLVDLNTRHALPLVRNLLIPTNRALLKFPSYGVVHFNHGVLWAIECFSGVPKSSRRDAIGSSEIGALGCLAGVGTMVLVGGIAWLASWDWFHSRMLLVIGFGVAALIYVTGGIALRVKLRRLNQRAIEAGIVSEQPSQALAPPDRDVS